MVGFKERRLMRLKKEHIEVIEMPMEGYQPLVDFQTWRVAVLKYCEDVRLDNIKTMQRHLETDEVFVLLSGNCILITGGDKESVDEIATIYLKPRTLYNVKRGVWHNHVLDEEGEVLIIENQNTSNRNSPTASLTINQLTYIKMLFQKQQ